MKSRASRCSLTSPEGRFSVWFSISRPLYTGLSKEIACEGREKLLHVHSRSLKLWWGVVRLVAFKETWSAVLEKPFQTLGHVFCQSFLSFLTLFFVLVVDFFVFVFFFFCFLLLPLNEVLRQDYKRGTRLSVRSMWTGRGSRMGLEGVETMSLICTMSF